MKILLLILVVLTAACELHVYNSATNDAFRFSSVSCDQSQPSCQRFAAAITVVKNNCVLCHSNMNAFQSDQDWISNGYVVKNNPATSSVFNRLRGAGLGGPQENMPQGGALSSAEVTTIRDWIQNMP